MYSYKKKENGIEINENEILVAEVINDAFNTETFNLVMGNVHLFVEDVDIEQMVDIAKENGFEHLSISLAVDSTKNIHSAEKSGFLLVDSLVTYVFDYNKIKLDGMKHLADLRFALKSDIPVLKDIAYNSFVIDRFHSDPALSKEKANLYYSKWIENSINGFAVETIVATVDGEPAGFTTVGKVIIEKGERIGRLVLSAVSPKARGKKVYTSMIYEGLVYNLGKADKILVGTQVNNYPVQKTWINLGGYMIDSKHILQKKIK